MGRGEGEPPGKRERMVVTPRSVSEVHDDRFISRRSDPIMRFIPNLLPGRLSGEEEEGRSRKQVFTSQDLI